MAIDRFWWIQRAKDPRRLTREPWLDARARRRRRRCGMPLLVLGGAIARRDAHACRRIEGQPAGIVQFPYFSLGAMQWWNRRRAGMTASDGKHLLSSVDVLWTEGRTKLLVCFPSLSPAGPRGTCVASLDSVSMEFCTRAWQKTKGWSGESMSGSKRSFQMRAHQSIGNGVGLW
jgi:hypothetical protein